MIARFVVWALCSLTFGCSGASETPPPAGSGGSGATAGSGGAGAAGGGAGGSGARTVSYRSDVAPLLEPCTHCHFKGSIVPYQFEDPFDPVTGVVGVMGDWTEARHRMLVFPGRPEESNLIDKLKGDLIYETEGNRMPMSMPLPTPAEVEAVRVWIANGALDDEQYRTSVAPLFGNATTLGSMSGKCSFCHTATSPNPPNLVNPFDAERGVVNKQSLGGILVVPGNPDASVLYRKVANMNLSRADGERMPIQFEWFTPDQIAIVEAWIRAGAKND